LPLDRDDVAIVQAIIALGHEFRLEVVAEGVETQAQEAFLHKHNCDAIQGFLLSKPLCTDDLWPLLKQWCCRDPYHVSGDRT
jgi:EAL domain-containing protein (putative c-di-GMP-specific phosphodiesterase class I)